MDIQTTLSHLGGYGKLRALVNARDFVKSDKERSLRFKFSGCSKYHIAKITLTPRDTYEIKLYKFRGVKRVRETEPVEAYASELRATFEQLTGLYLTF